MYDVTGHSEYTHAAGAGLCEATDNLAVNCSRVSTVLWQLCFSM